MSRSSSVDGSDGQIEFLAPNDTAFGMSDLADFVGFDDADDEAAFADEAPRSKWLPAIAAVVVFGLLGGGIIAAAPWDSGTTVAPAPTTTEAEAVTSIRARSTTTTERVLDVASFGPPGYVLDDPGDFQLAGVYAGNDGPEPRNDQFELWASPDARRTSGRWLAAATLSVRDHDPVVPGGIRVPAGSETGVIASSADGVASLSFVSNDDTSFELQAYGLSLDDLLSVAAQIGVAQDGTIDYGPLLDGIMADLSPVISARVPSDGLNVYGLLSFAEADAYYVKENWRQSIDIRLAQPNDVDDAVQRFLMAPVPDLGVADQAELDRLARHGLLFEILTIPGNARLYVASSVGYQPISVWAYNVGVSTLIQMLGQIRLAGDFEWADLADRSRRNEIEIEGDGGPGGGPNVTIGSSDTSDAAIPARETWSVEVQRDPLFLIVSTPISGSGFELVDIGTAPAVRHFASTSMTFVVATVESPSPVQRIRVTVEGLAPVEVPMAKINDAAFAAAYGYRDLLPATVEFLDAAGNVIASIADAAGAQS